MSNTTVQISRSDATRVRLLEQAAGEAIPSSGPTSVTLTEGGVAITFEIVD